MQGVALFERSHRQLKANKSLPHLELLGMILEILTAAKTKEADTFLI